MGPRLRGLPAALAPFLLDLTACHNSPSAAAKSAADPPPAARAAEKEEQKQRALATAGGGPALSPSPVKAKATVPPVQTEYEVDGHRFALVAEHDACYVSPRDSSGRDVRLPLGFPPPCHLLLWRRPPPIERPKDAVPLGQLGEPMAWKFAGRQPIVALVIIGGPVSDRQLAKRPFAKSTECPSRARAILLRGQSLALSKRTGELLVCTTSGLDEKDFWLFAHEP